MSFELRLLCGSKRSADILSQGRGCAGEAQGAFGLELKRCRAGEAFEQASDSAFVFEFLENFQTFAVKRMGRAAIALLSRQVSEVCECAGDAPAVAELAKH